MGIGLCSVLLVITIILECISDQCDIEEQTTFITFLLSCTYFHGRYFCLRSFLYVCKFLTVNRHKITHWQSPASKETVWQYIERGRRQDDTKGCMDECGVEVYIWPNEFTEMTRNTLLGGGQLPISTPPPLSAIWLCIWN